MYAYIPLIVSLLDFAREELLVMRNRPLRLNIRGTHVVVVVVVVVKLPRLKIEEDNIYMMMTVEGK